MYDPSLKIPAQWVAWALDVGGDPFRIEHARRMAVELMAENNVQAWTLRIGGAKDQAGSIRYTRVRRRWDGKPGTITLSGPLMSLWSDEQQRTTIKHEIAHALWPDDGHGRYWRMECVRLGIPPARLWGEDGETRIPGQWYGTCPGGHQHRPRQRQPRVSHSCSQCCPVYDKRYEVTWTREVRNEQPGTGHA